MIKTRANKIYKNKKSKFTLRNKQSNQKNLYSCENIVKMFFKILNTVKIYHWNTPQYAIHKATDELYDELNKNIDSFVEIMLGKSAHKSSFEQRIHLPKYTTITFFSPTTLNTFNNEIDTFITYLVNMTYDNKVNITNNSDLLNVRDEILGNLNQFKYLSTFK
jgi:DNA-binding ferritin-like protein